MLICEMLLILRVCYHNMQVEVMKDVKIGNNAYSVAWKLISILRQDRVNALWQLLFDPKTEPAKKKTKNRSKAATISYCLSGSLLLKVDSPYSC